MHAEGDSDGTFDGVGEGPAPMLGDADEESIGTGIGAGMGLNEHSQVLFKHSPPTAVFEFSSS